MTATIVYEHDLIADEQQTRIGAGEYVFVSLGDKLYWVHEPRSGSLTITDVAARTDVLDIPVTRADSWHNRRLRVVVYDATTLWIGRHCVVGRSRTNEVLVVDLHQWLHHRALTYLDIRHVTAIAQTYFSVKTDDALTLFKWRDLFTLNTTRPICAFTPDVAIYPLHWRGCTMCKTIATSPDLDFMNDQFVTLFRVPITDLFAHYEPLEKRHETDAINTLMCVHDNLIMYVEYREVVTEKSWIIEPGCKRVYAFDFTNNTDVLFEQTYIDHFISKVVPYRHHGRIKYIAYEWFPAGNWTALYSSL